MTAHVIRGDARCLPLPDESVDLIVTSPPYWAQRSYQDDGEHYAGQIGDEDDPRAYVRDLLGCVEEWTRVLKPTGSIFVNLGDKYGERAGPGRAAGEDQDHPHYRKATRPRRRQAEGVRPKSLILLPERFRIGCVDELGLIARQVVVWDKPNPTPESVGDRPRRSHEDWVHLVKQPRYYSAMDELREPYDAATAKRYALGYNDRAIDTERLTVNTKLGGDAYDENPLGKLPGSVWRVATEPLIVPDVSPLDGRPLPKHFAAFPTEWPRRFVLGFSPSGICLECGEGRRPAVEARRTLDGAPASGSWQTDARSVGPQGVGHWRYATSRTRVGEVCGCNEPIGTPLGRRGGDDPTLETGRAGFNRDRAPDAGRRVITRHEQRHYAAQLRAHPNREYLRREAGADAFDHYVRTDRTGARAIPPALLEEWLAVGVLEEPPSYVPASTRPAVVVDPFGGTGTVALVADVLGRIGISGDLSHDYGRLARWRTTNPGERARAMRVDKPPVQVSDQAALW
jgi:DNA modification methylase